MHKLNRPKLDHETAQALKEYQQNHPVTAKKQTENARWGTFKERKKKLYRKIRDCLEKNQQGLCAYCEISLKENNKQIEHFVPKVLTTREKDWTFDFRNFTAACRGNEYKHDDYYSDNPSRKSNMTCGAKKGRLDPRGAICNPYELPNAPVFSIVYQEDGIKYAVNATVCKAHNLDPALVENTIESLGLNCPNLMRRRKRAWDALMIEENRIYKHSSPKDIALELEEMKQDNVLPVAGKLPDFITLRRLFFGENKE